MILSPNLRTLAFTLVAGLAPLPFAPAAFAQAEEALFVATDRLQGEPAPAAPERTRTLLDEVKKSELDRLLAVKQTELERIKQDQEKTERDAATVQKSIDSMTALIDGSSEAMTKLTTESRRLEHELALAEVRITAERLKVDGLRALSAARTKSLAALARHGEEAEARARLRTAEMALLKEGKPIPAETKDELAQSEIGKCRKALALAEARTEAEERAAREAMKAAEARMELADAKASMAKRLAENDLTLPPIAEKTKPKPSEKSAEKRESDPPVRKTPATASTIAKSTPRPVVSTRATPPPRGPFFGR